MYVWRQNCLHRCITRARLPTSAVAAIVIVHVVVDHARARPNIVVVVIVIVVCGQTMSFVSNIAKSHQPRHFGGTSESFQVRVGRFRHHDLACHSLKDMELA